MEGLATFSAAEKGQSDGCPYRKNLDPSPCKKYENQLRTNSLNVKSKPTKLLEFNTEKRLQGKKKKKEKLLQDLWIGKNFSSRRQKQQLKRKNIEKLGFLILRTDIHQDTTKQMNEKTNNGRT